MKTIIAGSRTIRDYAEVVKAVGCTNFKITEVVSGCANGPDRLGEQWAADNGVPVKKFIARWQKHGKVAGHIRNAEMAAYADALIAVWDGVSKGTLNMINIAHSKGLKVYVHEVKG